MAVTLGRTRGWRRRVAWVSLAAALLAAASLCARWRPPVSRRDLFPRHSSAAIAHILADFSNYVPIYPDIESWAIEDEWSNYTSWRYEATYECGVRCAGRVTLRHDALGERAEAPDGAEAGRLRHGHARRHRVSARDVRCTRLPLLPWLDLCEETETETLITDSEEGAVVQETQSGRCGALTTLLARCVRDTRDTRDTRTAAASRVRVALAQ